MATRCVLSSAFRSQAKASAGKLLAHARFWFKSCELLGLFELASASSPPACRISGVGRGGSARTSRGDSRGGVDGVELTAASAAGTGLEAAGPGGVAAVAAVGLE